MNSQSYENQCALFLLNRLAGSKVSEISCLLKAGRPPADIIREIREQNAFELEPELNKIEEKFQPEEEMEKCVRLGISCLSVCDETYPGVLKEIHDPPIMLYVRGQLLEADTSVSLAIVGSRHATSYGTYHARKFAREMCEKGFTVVSGLARGIDQAAHEGALEAPLGRTVAVLGCGVDGVYPPESEKLYRRIIERGAVISEYALGARPLAHHFPKRNRIISGLSLGVLVVEAHVRSGSLITAREALEQGRDVFAVPGRIDQLTSLGTLALLKEGACLVDASWVMVEALADEARRRLCETKVTAEDRKSPVLHGAGVCRPSSESISPCVCEPPDAEILRLLLTAGSQGMTCQELQQRAGIPGEKFFPILLRLELSRRLKRNPDGRYAVNVR